MIYDFCIIGGGIVGLATAMAVLEKRPDASIILIEKEDSIAVHQTGHNSGVIHAGIYYAPGSLKAKLCRDGLKATRVFCDEHDVPYERCGKLIVATNQIEQKRINLLFERATENGLVLNRLNREELRAREPRIEGISALFSPETGIVDYRQVAAKMAELISNQGVEISLGYKIERIIEKISSVEVSGNDRTWRANKLIVCGGTQADRLARLAGIEVHFRIVPFRGEYFQLPPEKNDIIKHLIYPAPTPSLPFLGVHLTRMLNGSVTVGPNAVLGFAREKYPKFSMDVRDIASFMSFNGFWKLMWKHRRHAWHELKSSLWRSYYLDQCRKYCPELELDDLRPHEAGIRSQLVTDKGVAVHDFLFGKTGRMLHVYNAPSPAATSAIPIGKMIVAECVT